MDTDRSLYREDFRPDGTVRSFCYFCGLEVPEDEVHEWGAWGLDAGGFSTIVRAHRNCKEEGLEWRDGEWRLKGASTASTTQPAGAPPGFPVADLPKRTLVRAQPNKIQTEGKAVGAGRVPRSSGGEKALAYRLVGRASGERDDDRYYNDRFYVTPVRYPDRLSAFTALQEYATSIGVEPQSYLPLTVYTPDGRYYEMVNIESCSGDASDYEDDRGTIAIQRRANEAGSLPKPASGR